MDFTFFREVIVAIAIGLLIGLEREIYFGGRSEGKSLGSRTFAIITLMGYLVATLNDVNAMLLPVAIFILGCFLLVSYIFASLKPTEKKEQQIRGFTTEFSAFLSFFAGIAIVVLDIPRAVFITVVLVTILYLKGQITALRSVVEARDKNATIMFLLMTFVILPILPNHPIDPYGLVNLYKIWLLVVFISGISFMGYIAIRILGTSRGILLTGFFGGFVSSTAVTISMSKRAKISAELTPNLASAIVLASSTMFARVIILCAIIYFPIAKEIAVPYLAATLAGYVYIWFLYKKATKQQVDQEVLLTNPLEFKSALKLGILLGIVFGVMTIVQRYSGDAGIYIASTISGLTDVDAITLSLGQLGAEGKIAVHIAVVGIILASIANTFTKLGISLYTGTKQLGKYVFGGYALCTIALLVTYFIQELMIGQ